MSERYEGIISANGLMWVLCKLRKPAVCFSSGEKMNVGDDAYRPITNGIDRSKRIKPMKIHRKKISPPNP